MWPIMCELVEAGQVTFHSEPSVNHGHRASGVAGGDLNNAVAHSIPQRLQKMPLAIRSSIERIGVSSSQKRLETAASKRGVVGVLPMTFRTGLQ